MEFLVTVRPHSSMVEDMIKRFVGRADFQQKHWCRLAVTKTLQSFSVNYWLHPFASGNKQKMPVFALTAYFNSVPNHRCLSHAIVFTTGPTINF